MNRPSSSLITGLILLGVALIAGWLLITAVQNALRPPQMPTLGGVATQAQQLFNPTPVAYPSAATVILQVRALARLETVQYTIEKVVTAQSGQSGALAPLLGDKLLFVAHGRVLAGVDLSKLGPNDVRVDETGAVTIILPAAEVFETVLDNDKSFVYDRTTGLFTQGDPNLETLARQVAEREIRNGALEDGILLRAQTNAESVLTSLLYSLKFTQVTIVRATPLP